MQINPVKWDFGRFREDGWVKITFNSTRSAYPDGLGLMYDEVRGWLAKNAKGEWMSRVQDYRSVVMFACNNDADATYVMLMFDGGRMTKAKLSATQRHNLKTRDERRQRHADAVAAKKAANVQYLKELRSEVARRT